MTFQISPRLKEAVKEAKVVPINLNSPTVSVHEDDKTAKPNQRVSEHQEV